MAIQRWFRGWFGILGLCLLMLAGCGGTARLAISAGNAAIVGRMAPPALSAISLAEASQNRLLITGNDGNLFTLRPDGAAAF